METGIAKVAARKDQKRKGRPCERPQGSHFHAPDLMNNPTNAKGEKGRVNGRYYHTHDYQRCSGSGASQTKTVCVLF